MEYAIICNRICDSVFDSDSMIILFRKLYVTIFQKDQSAKRARDASSAHRYQSEGLSLNQKQNIENTDDRNYTLHTNTSSPS